MLEPRDFRFRQVSSHYCKEWYDGRRPELARLKWLSQILKERARLFEIRGFESFREAVVHASKRMPGLIALPTFAEQAGQDHRRP
jgi:hypothetical protein